MQKSIKKSIKIMLLIILCFCCLFPFFSLKAHAAHVFTLNQLIEQEDRLDQTLVTVRGEAIGEPLKRGSECWVNINDGTNAIGIKMKETDAKHIKCFGNYKQKGDVIQIEGIFHKACSADGGETDIHSKSVKIISHGIETIQTVSAVKIVAAILSAILIIFLVGSGLKHRSSAIG
ncbi:MAG: hypothetical protein PHE09_16525 [Oscillospiraceae bacterium]|nr:hypothetical protein [Oscillospiraceae bacterium]